ncbi:c-type cytochrome [Geojedonia litorea]|uniref:C-type cytochrome n=1 Tax=Geojedonia litorea TaxID=1268269 RepID=A0ABV9N2I7_9FLAO
MVIRYIVIVLLALSPIAMINSNSQGYFTQSTALQESISRGKMVYSDFCIVCHLANGEGVKGIYPPLANSDYLKNKRIESIKSVKYGMQGEITVNGKVYNSVMAPMGLTDQEIADVMNYITTSWGNTNAKAFTENEVSKVQP